MLGRKLDKGICRWLCGSKDGWRGEGVGICSREDGREAEGMGGERNTKEQATQTKEKGTQRNEKGTQRNKKGSQTKEIGTRKEGERDAGEGELRGHSHFRLSSFEPPEYGCSFER
eukprot:jgi/Botrbrau1/4871/Bobra.0032s0027.1